MDVNTLFLDKWTEVQTSEFLLQSQREKKSICIIFEEHFSKYHHKGVTWIVKSQNAAWNETAEEKDHRMK